MFNIVLIHDPSCRCDECAELLLAEAIDDFARGIRREMRGAMS